MEAIPTLPVYEIPFLHLSATNVHGDPLNFSTRALEFLYSKKLILASRSRMLVGGVRLRNDRSMLKCVSYGVFLLFVLCAGSCWNVIAQSESLVFETEQHWDTFGVGGTCISGGHSLAVADIDGDYVKEMVTGGSSYFLLPNGSRTVRSAPFKIWSWNGKNLELEKGHNWTGNIGCVYTGDANGDGRTEVVTAGGVSNSTGSYASLTIWTWNGKTLIPIGSYEGTNVGSVSVSDFDGDGNPEIATVGRFTNGTESIARLSIFKLTASSLSLITSVDCCGTNGGRANSVYTSDLDNDGVIEIVTAGYSNDVRDNSGQLRVWQFDGRSLSLEDNVEWQMVGGVYSLDVAGNPMGNTAVSTVKVADVDNDGVPEIVTAGFTYDGARMEGQIRIWNWDHRVFSIERSGEWSNLDITQPISMSIDDVDGDGRREVVTSGCTAAYGSWAANASGKTRAMLNVWSWDGKDFVMEQDEDWFVGDAVSAASVGTGDVDNDGLVEIVTVGCMQTGALCDPDLRIWSLSLASNPSANFSLIAAAAVGVVLAIAVLIAAFKFMRKRQQ